ncbi:ORF6N domain-containing protein [Clostridium sp. UBA1353]|uniref:ORF6N domain-containing protein n=1 Tax=Clostridium sp. UBA1353 TaxID=1946347 RepID=UPI0032165D07
MDKLIPMELKKQRIMTTEILAEQYGTYTERIRQNYLRNEKRFVEGKHYYKLVGDELRSFKAEYLNDTNLKFAKELLLWTEKGAARHAKILDTDEAWEVYEELEETYFKVKGNVQALNTSQLSPELQMFNKLFEAMAKQELENNQIKEEIKETKESIQGIRDVVAINSTDWKVDCKSLVIKIANKLGGFNHIQDVYKEIYSTLEKRMGVQLNIRLTNKRRRMADEGICKSKRDKLNYIDVIADDKKLIEGYVAITKELAIKYGAA